MLVLSRRPNEKILFPSIGISVEIVQTKGNTVRVGIEAPEDIRILRGELENHESPNSLMQLSQATISNTSNTADYNETECVEFVRRIEEIELALALAQNQRRQGLSEHADVALEQAIERLQQLKSVFGDSKKTETLVFEKKPVYSTRKQTTQLVVGSNDGHGFRLEFDLGV